MSSYYWCDCGEQCHEDDRVYDSNLDKYVCPKCKCEMHEDYTLEEQIETLEKEIVSLKALVEDLEKAVYTGKTNFNSYMTMLEKITQEMGRVS